MTTLALSEPGTGSEFWLPQTRLHNDGEHVVLNGTKSFVTNGPQVDSYVINLVTQESASAAGTFSMVALDADSPGMHWGPAWHGFGMRGNDSRSLQLREVRLHRSHLLGEHGDEIWYVFNVVAPYFLVAMAGTYLGVAAAALDAARDHLKRRRHTHSGRRMSAVPVLQHRLGGMWGQVERARRLLYFAAEEAQAGGPAALLALCAAKAEIAETVETVTNEAMTLIGGIGYAGDETMQRLLRDGRAARRIPTPQLQLARLVITDTADHLAVGVIHGLAGLGKTFAMKTCTTALAARTRPKNRIEVVTIAFPSRPTMRLLADLLLQTLTGAPPVHQANRFYLGAGPRTRPRPEAGGLTRHLDGVHHGGSAPGNRAAAAHLEHPAPHCPYAAVGVRRRLTS